jgi:serine/threonine protein kinase
MAAGAGERASSVNVEPLTSDDPRRVGRYRVHARLGAGGMGTVYLAFTPGGRPVALKMIRPELADNVDFRNRFRQEVDAARRVHGLYTAQVLDAHPDASPPWLVTAFVPGLSLQEAVSRHGPLPVDTVLVLMAGVAEALEVIHAAGVVHRDLKPSNVVLAPDGPRVIDFGIARAADATPLTGGGIGIGSPYYMAPEQVANSPVGPAADVFALGAVAVYAALGRSPFGEGAALPVMYRVLHEPADLSGCPSVLRAIIERCLAKKAPDRPSTAEVISWCRVMTAGRTRQIAQPWLPPGVVAALADHPPLPSPALAGRPDSRQVSASPPGSTAPDARSAPAAIISGQPRGTSASTTVPAQPTAKVPARRSGRPAWAAAVVLGVLVLTAAACIWLADSDSPAGHPAPDRTHPTSPAASWLAGTWVGSADQPTGMVTHWTAELTFARSGRVGTFRFPSLGCSGTLIVTGTTPTTASVHEDLTQNQHKICAPSGLMTLSRSGATGMRMRWQDATNRSNVATGYLKPR